MREKSKAAYMISSVAEQYGVHPQTLRLYEREGLLKPSRSDGNTRLYTEEDLERLEVILHLTRDLGVNLAGVEIILNMRAKMEAMQQQIEEFVQSLNHELANRPLPEPAGKDFPDSRNPDRDRNPPPQLIRHSSASDFPWSQLAAVLSISCTCECLPRNILGRLF